MAHVIEATAVVDLEQITDQDQPTANSNAWIICMYIIHVCMYLFPFGIFSLSPFNWNNPLVSINITDTSSMHSPYMHTYQYTKILETDM